MSQKLDTSPSHGDAPRWLREMDRAFRAGIPGCVLTFNIHDYVLAPGVPPSRLRPFLAQHFKRQDIELVVFFSRAGGCELWLADLDERGARQTVERFERHTGLRAHGDAAGGAEVGRESGATADLREALPALTRLLRQRNVRTAVIVDYAHFLAPATQGMSAIASPDHVLAVETLHRWSLDETIRMAGNRVVVLGDDGHLSELIVGQGSGFKVIAVDLPDLATRADFIALLERLTASGRREFGRLAEDLTRDESAALTAGLGLADIDGLVRTAAVEGTPVSREAIRYAKSGAIRALGRDLVEVFETTRGLEAVAGLRHVVEYLEDVTALLRMGSRTVPRAILLAGVPGVGKTFVVKSWAHSLGWNCLAMRSIRSKWVGQSEANLERMLQLVHCLAPCILFTDEVDASIGRREAGGDSGVSERLFGRLLEFTSLEEHRGRVLWVGATNRPDLLDPALVDRFGVVLPFLAPSPPELQSFLPILAGQLGRAFAADVRLEELASLEPLRCISARGLLEVIAAAANWTDRDAGRPNSPIDHAHLLAAVLDHRADFNPLEHELIALTALRLTSFSSLLPWRTRTGVRADYPLPAYLLPLVDHETGLLGDAQVDDRLAHLRQVIRR
ncbi:MAG: ATP-binding protein [Actinobacteria bacterium]|nr:ATP-binding protein [Actinomycetota bacterium]